MATIHKLTKDGATIFPATITDAVVHQDTGKTLTSMIKEYNVSELFPTEGIAGGNTYNLALAVQVLGTHLRASEKTGGIKLTFISSVYGGPVEEYYLGKNVWSGVAADWKQRFEVGDAIIDPAGDWDPSSAETYIDSQIATEAATRLAQDTYLGNEINVIKKNKIYLTGSTLSQSQINQTNTIYVIKDNLTLTENINIPSGCTLEFEGGSISGNGSNDTITGNSTVIKAGLENIFKTTKLNGTWNIENACIKWFGIEGINTKDYTDDFYRVMDFLYYNNGGTLFIPKGYYTVNNTIGIPANTTIEGEGKESVIYYTGENPWLGVALAPTGDNIIIKNLTVNYAEDDITCFKQGAQFGSIGVTTLNYTPNTTIDNYPSGNVKHIVLENIFSINTSPLQTEPGELPYIVEDIKYINCYCPNGKIRCSPTANSAIYGMLIEGCNCKEIGIGYGERTLKSAIINNCICNSLVLSDDNIIVSNTVVKAIGVYDYNDGDITLRNYAVFVNSNNLYFNNVIIQNENVNVTKGIWATEHYHSTNVIFNSVYINGFTNSFTNPNGWEFVYSNCKFINSNGSSLPLSGVAFGCDISTSHYGGIRLLDRTYNVPVTLATGVEASAVLPQFITVTGVNVHIQVCFSIPNGNLFGGVELFTISEKWRPSEDRYIKADYVILETDLQKPITLKIASATGIVSVSSIYTTYISPNTNLRIIIDGFYCIK